jgi:antiviral helicase SLH1
VADDPHLVSQRHELVTHAARELAKLGMITFDQSRGSLSPTDLGRIAAKYYIRHASIEVFRENFRPKMSEADVLAMLSMSTEVCDYASYKRTKGSKLHSLSNFKCVNRN